MPKFAQVRQFRANFQKIQDLKEIDRFDRFWPNSIPKILDQYSKNIIQKIKNPIKSQIDNQFS